MKTLADLLTEFGSRKYIPYFDLLQTSEWQNRRREIMDRDRCLCAQCLLGTMPHSVDIFYTRLHVHHKYYVLNKWPWEYPDEAFVTLCRAHHYSLHEAEKIPVYDKTGTTLDATPCLRCNGAGYLKEYRRIQNGICFRCSGAKYEELIGKDDRI